MHKWWSVRASELAAVGGRRRAGLELSGSPDQEPQFWWVAIWALASICYVGQKWGAHMGVIIQKVSDGRLYIKESRLSYHRKSCTYMTKNPGQIICLAISIASIWLDWCDSSCWWCHKGNFEAEVWSIKKMKLKFECIDAEFSSKVSSINHLPNFWIFKSILSFFVHTSWSIWFWKLHCSIWCISFDPKW